MAWLTRQARPRSGSRQCASAGTMSGRPTRIGLLGQFGIGNLGNNASLEAMVEGLRVHAPAAELCVISQDAARTPAVGLPVIPLDTPNEAGVPRALNRALAGVPSRAANFWHAIAVMRGLDGLIVPGTGVFDDFGERPSGLPYDIWRWCSAASFVGKRVAFVSVGAGPITNPLSLRLLRSAARKARYRSFRDAPSLDFMRAVGAAGPDDHVTPDLAFFLPRPERTPRSPGAPQTIAVGVMNYQGWTNNEFDVYERYIEVLSEYVAWLLQGGSRVQFVIGKDSDEATVDAVRSAALARAPDGAGAIAPFVAARTQHEVMAQMAQADICVATRFHNVVAALSVGTPAISIGYAAKNETLLTSVGLGGFSTLVETCDVDWLKTHTERLLNARSEHATVLRERVDAYRDELDGQMREVAMLFGAAQGRAA